MPIKKCKKTKRTKNQLRYNRKQIRDRKRLYHLIQEDYIVMAGRNINSGYIIKVLQAKYPNKSGEPCSRQTIYNALNFKYIHKRIQATHGERPVT